MKGWGIQAETASLSVDNENCVARVTHNRIYSIAAHPSTDCLIVGAGDKDGTVGLWNIDGVTLDEDHSASIHMFRVHNAPVCCLHWTQGNSLLSASYDGTVRKLDATTGVFHEIFATYDGDSLYAEDVGHRLEEMAKSSSFECCSWLVVVVCCVAVVAMCCCCYCCRCYCR